MTNKEKVTCYNCGKKYYLIVKCPDCEADSFEEGWEENKEDE